MISRDIWCIVLYCHGCSFIVICTKFMSYQNPPDWLSCQMDPIAPTSMLINKIQEILLAVVLVLQVSCSACQLLSQAQVELCASAVMVMIRGTSSSSFKKKDPMIMFGIATLVYTCTSKLGNCQSQWTWRLWLPMPVRLQWSTIFALQVQSPTLLWLARAKSCWHAVDPLFSWLRCSSLPFTSTWTFSHPLC